MNWIAYSGVTRNQHNSKWWLKAILTVAAGTAAAAGMGGLIGVVSAGAPPSVRSFIAIASLCGLSVFLLAGHTAGVSLLPQYNRETQQTLLDRGPVQWAVANGALLGVGFTSRLGSWLWYMIPLTILFTGDVGIGALIYATYGFVRLMMPATLAAFAVARRNTDIAEATHRYHVVAIRVADAAFVFLALTTVVSAI